MADLTPISSWTVEDVLHLGRRAGFGLSPEAAAALAAQPPGAAIDAWVSGAGLDFNAFDAALAHADPVDQPASGAAGAVAAPHRYLVGGADAWRNDLSRAQAYVAFRMQYSPYSLQERLALFWHNLFATGWQKVGSTALVLQQQETLRTMGLARFDDLHVALSKDPAMCIWLDSVLNRADGDNVPNENYARESMELYALGADNGYNQQDITQLARALSGWSFTVAAADTARDPNGGRRVAVRGTFRVYDGSPVSGEYLWNDVGADAPPARLPRNRASGAVTFLGKTFDDVDAAPTGMAKGEAVLRAIVSERGPQAAADRRVGHPRQPGRRSPEPAADPGRHALRVLRRPGDHRRRRRQRPAADHGPRVERVRPPGAAEPERHRSRRRRAVLLRGARRDRRVLQRLSRPARARRQREHEVHGRLPDRLRHPAGALAGTRAGGHRCPAAAGCAHRTLPPPRPRPGAGAARARRAAAGPDPPGRLSPPPRPTAARRPGDPRRSA